MKIILHFASCVNLNAVKIDLMVLVCIQTVTAEKNYDNNNFLNFHFINRYFMVLYQ